MPSDMPNHRTSGVGRHPPAGEFLLDPSVTFLNHGSFGATPRAVFERYQEWQLELEREPLLFLARRLDALLAEARAALGAYIGVNEDDLVFVPNATAGVNIAAWPLPFLRNRWPTDRIPVTPCTCPIKIADRPFLRVHQVDLTAGGSFTS